MKTLKNADGTLLSPPICYVFEVYVQIDYDEPKDK